MIPVKKHKVITGIVAAALLTAALSVGSTHSRLIEWAGTEYIYTPAEAVIYDSDCLTPQGQTIRLRDWEATEDQRSIAFAVSGPAAQDVPEDPAQAQTQETQPPDDEMLTVTPDAQTAEHIAVSAEMRDSKICITLTRRQDAPGLSQQAQMRFDVQWQQLQGTVCFLMLPYGNDSETGTSTDATEPETTQQQVQTGLQLFGACDVMDTQAPISVAKLNLQTCADFVLQFSADEQPVTGIRWSMDGGKTYTMLYDSHELQIPWPYPQDWDGVVYLDCSRVLAAQQRLTVKVMATDYASQEYSPVRQSVPTANHFVLPATEMPYLVEMNTQWGSAQLMTPTIQRLTTDAQAGLSYVDDPKMTASVEDGGIRLSPAANGELPASGSYRMTLRWEWDGNVVKEAVLFFFVNTR